MRAPAKSTPRTLPGGWLAHPAVKPTVFVLALLPFAWLLWGAFTNNLGANPAEKLVRSTGDWALRFLCLTLAVTPVRVVANLPALARLRRMLGLFMFFYACLHLLCYSWLDKGLEIAEIAKDIPKRPFILVGFTAFVLLLPLAATSFNRAVRAVGAARWRRLHQLVYLIAGLAVLHFFWMRSAKNNYNEVIVYGGILAVLLAWRVLHKLRGRRTAPAASAVPVGRTATIRTGGGSATRS